MLSDILENVSLLWPDNESKKQTENKIKLSETSFTDINLDRIVSEFAIDPKYTSYVKNVLSSMCEDTEVINYRLDIIDDIVNSSELQKNLEGIYSIVSEVERYAHPESLDTPEILKLVKSFRETDIFGNSLSRIKCLIEKSDNNFKAEGLRKLKDVILTLSEQFEYNYDNKASNIEDDYFKPTSITLGINLDNQLRPVEATIVSLNDQKYLRAPFLNHLVSKNKDEFESTFDFHSTTEGLIKNKLINEIEELGESKIKIDSTALQLSLISDLDRIIKSAIIPLKFILRRYINTYSEFFIKLKYELLFILGTINIIKKITTLGMPMCRPKPENKSKRIFDIKGLYNLSLALDWDGSKPNSIVKNDLEFTSEENIFILTGPNSGGKTTYINAISLIQVLFQAGMYVPCAAASISPVDSIYTHFSAEEKKDTDYGRLGEEAKRLNEIFKRATEYSLLILNESLASTSPSECLYMSKDIIYGLKLLSAHAIFATHQHELAENLELVNKTYPGAGKISSLLAGAQKLNDSEKINCFKRTYKVEKSAPLGTSYAKDIAESFGISFEQIKDILNKRFVTQKF